MTTAGRCNVRGTWRWITYSGSCQVDLYRVLCPWVVDIHRAPWWKNMWIQLSAKLVPPNLARSTCGGQSRVDQRTVFCKRDFPASVCNGVRENPVLVVMITLLSWNQIVGADVNVVIEYAVIRFGVSPVVTGIHQEDLESVSCVLYWQRNTI